MKNDKNKAKVPKVRFPEFTDAWEQRELGEIAERVRGNDGRMGLPTLTISAGKGWLDQRERFSGNIAGKEQQNYTLLKQGELSYNKGNSKLAKYGVVFQLSDYEEALVPRVYHSFKMSEGYSAAFIEYLFSTKIPDRELGKLITSGARMDGLLNINYEDFMGIKVTLPRFAEQEKIGQFLRSLDRLITLHQRKLSNVKELKVGLLQKMFPKNGENKPEVRFPEFTDAWEQRELGEIAERVRGNDGRMGLPTLTISAGKGWLDQRERFSGNIAGKEQQNYTLLKQGELSYNKGNSKLAKYGVVFQLSDYEEALVPRVYHSFKMSEGYSAAFIEYLFSTKIPDRELGKLITSGARMDGLLNINYEDFMGIKVTLPRFAEQEKIGQFLRSLDRLITLHQRKLDHLQEQKKALLQQMFI